jgi:hypothetical protein
MTQRSGFPARLADAQGMRVKVKHALSNGLISIPPGSRGTISGYQWSHLRFKGEPCACCGVTPYVTRVPVEFLEAE